MISPIKGIAYPKFFKDAIYSSRTVKPIKRLFKLGRYVLYLVKRPRYIKGTSVFKYNDWCIIALMDFGIKIKIEEYEKNTDKKIAVYDYYEKIAKLDLKKSYLISCYNEEDKYIGNVEMVYDFIMKHKINFFDIAKPNNRVCSIGYNAKDKKWFGWSHRALCGFGVGDTCRKENIHFMPSNKEEFKENVINFWLEGEDNREFKEAKEIIKGDKKGIEVSWKWRKNTPNKSIRGKIDSVFSPYPDKWGRGEWEAKTIEDAKQMAMDFANSV